MIDAYIGIWEGKITYIGRERPNGIIEAEIPGEGLFVLPGVVDSHVHFRTPGFEHKEDFLHGSHAAVAGGVTTILDMPNTKPSVSTRQTLRDKEQLIKKQSYVDYGFHFLLTTDNFSEITSLSPSEISSVKVFYGRS